MHEPLRPTEDSGHSGGSAHLDPYPVGHTQPEEQQGAQEHRLEEVVQHPGEPAVHQKGQREERIWNANGRQPEEGSAPAPGEVVN